MKEVYFYFFILNSEATCHVRVHCIVLFSFLEEMPHSANRLVFKGSSLIHVTKAKINTNTHNNKDIV